MNRIWKKVGPALLTLTVSLFAVFRAEATEIHVDIAGTRGPSDIDSLVQASVKRYTWNLYVLSQTTRALRGDKAIFTMPVRVILTSNGIPLAPSGGAGSRGGGGIIPVFDSTGPRVFPTTYQTYLQSVFTNAESVLNLVFGSPSLPGNVKILNYDADIQARNAVAGGYYVPNAPGGPEIRFPIYQSTTSAGINYIHCLLLAYLGMNQYAFDAYNEGLVRAATMKISRTAGVLPGSPGSDQIEQTLDSLYDVSGTYDWDNQPGLGAPTFIAPNLLNTSLPAGGSTGGIYLKRYQLAGTTFSKVLTEYPNFIAEFNRRFYQSPTSYQTTASLEKLGQDTINFLSGGTGSIEGFSFADWALRQAILDCRLNPGLKLTVETFPISPTAGSSDFGVFAVILNAFRTDIAGNETLLGGTSYPLYWRPDFTRFFMSAQDDLISLGGGYGSVVPNFPGDTFGGQIYRVAVDVPFQGKIRRVYLPAGGVATGAAPTANNFYGTLTGVPYTPSNQYQVSITWPGGTATNIKFQNLAFGTSINDPTFAKAQKVSVTVSQVSGTNSTPLFTRTIDKGLGPLAVDLRTPDCDLVGSLVLRAGLAMTGLGYEPYRGNVADIMGIADGQTLAARYNPIGGKYDFYPFEGSFGQGLGFFLRADAAAPMTYRAITSTNTPIAVHLQGGWNMITAPSQSAVQTTGIQVTTTSQSVGLYADAQGTLISNTFFKFVPDPINRDAGTMQAATSFEPGQSYFVRALKPEGAVMLFSAVTRSRERGAWIGGHAGEVGALASYIPGIWRSRIQAFGPAGTTCDIVLGQQMGASDGYVAKEDDQLPPWQNGFQMMSANGGEQYADIRAPGPGKSFQVVLRGLTPYNRYVLRLRRLMGRQEMILRDENGRIVRFDDIRPYAFTAFAYTRTLTVTVR